MWYAHPLGLLNPAEIYLAMPYLWDALIYLLIFLGLASAVFQNEKLYGKKSGKPIAIGIGLALTFAMLLWEYTMGWYIGATQFALLPVTILAFIILVLFYKSFTEVLGFPAHCAGAISYLITYTGVIALFEPLLEGTFLRFPLIGAFLALLTLAAVILLVICIIKLFPAGDPDKRVANAIADREVAKEQAAQEDEERERKKAKKEAAARERDEKIAKYTITAPLDGATFEHGEPIEVRADITGGPEHHKSRIYILEPRKDRTIVPGRTARGNPAATTFKDVPPGTWRVMVMAYDRKTPQKHDMIVIQVKPKTQEATAPDHPAEKDAVHEPAHEKTGVASEDAPTKAAGETQAAESPKEERRKEESRAQESPPSLSILNPDWPHSKAERHGNRVINTFVRDLKGQRQFPFSVDAKRRPDDAHIAVLPTLMISGEGESPNQAKQLAPDVVERVLKDLGVYLPDEVREDRTRSKFSLIIGFGKNHEQSLFERLDAILGQEVSSFRLVLHIVLAQGEEALAQEQLELLFIRPETPAPKEEPQPEEEVKADAEKAEEKAKEGAEKAEEKTEKDADEAQDKQGARPRLVIVPVPPPQGKLHAPRGAVHGNRAVITDYLTNATPLEFSMHREGDAQYSKTLLRLSVFFHGSRGGEPFKDYLPEEILKQIPVRFLLEEKELTSDGEVRFNPFRWFKSNRVQGVASVSGKSYITIQDAKARKAKQTLKLFVGDQKNYVSLFEKLSADPGSTMSFVLEGFFVDAKSNRRTDVGHGQGIFTIQHLPQPGDEKKSPQAKPHLGERSSPPAS